MDRIDDNTFEVRGCVLEGAISGTWEFTMN